MAGSPLKRSFTEVIHAYLRSGPEETRSIWAYLQDHEPYLFAHHPADPCFRSHVWRVGGFYWCKGCVLSAAGILAGLVLQFGLGWLGALSDLQLGLCLMFFLSPTLLAVAFRLPAWFKHSARFLLGLTVASAFLHLFVTESWLVRALILAAFFAIRQPLVTLRKRMNQKLLESK